MPAVWEDDDFWHKVVRAACSGLIMFKTFPWKAKALSRKLHGQTSVAWHLNLFLDGFENCLCLWSLKEAKKALKSYRNTGIKDFIIPFFSPSVCIFPLLGEK